MKYSFRDWYYVPFLSFDNCLKPILLLSDIATTYDGDWFNHLEKMKWFISWIFLGLQVYRVLCVSRTIYVNIDSPNLGFPYFNLLGGYQLQKTPCIFMKICNFGIFAIFLGLHTMKWICCMCHHISGHLKCWSWYSFPHLEKSPHFDLVWPPFRAANPSFGLTFAYFLLTFLFVDKRNGWDYIYLNTKEVSLSFYSNSFTMNLRQRKQFLPLPGLQVISKHSSQFFC